MSSSLPVPERACAAISPTCSIRDGHHCSSRSASKLPASCAAVIAVVAYS
jgi:hypothetical protein